MTPHEGELDGKTNVDFGPNCDTTTRAGQDPDGLRAAVRRAVHGQERRRHVAGRDGRRDQDRRLHRRPGEGPAAGRPAPRRRRRRRPGSDPGRRARATSTSTTRSSSSTAARSPSSSSSAPGPDRTRLAAKADAIAIADKKPFAVLGGPAQSTTVFADELAHRGVLCLGTCSLAVPEKLTRGEQALRLRRTGRHPRKQPRSRPSSSASRSARGRREFAGDDATKNKNRVYGIAALRHARRPVRRALRHSEIGPEEAGDHRQGRSGVLPRPRAGRRRPPAR